MLFITHHSCLLQHVTPCIVVPKALQLLYKNSLSDCVITFIGWSFGLLSSFLRYKVNNQLISYLSDYTGLFRELSGQMCVIVFRREPGIQQSLSKF